MDAQGNVYCQDKTRYRRAGRWRSNLLGGETGDSIMMFEETVPAGTKSTFHLHHASLILKRDFLAFQRGLQWSQANAYVERCSSRSTANLAKRACVTARYVAVQTERRFSANVPVTVERHRLLTGREHIREYESSPGAFRAFCSHCGSPVYARVISDPAHIRIRLGTLAKEARAKVVAHVWVLSKPDWYSICDDLPQYEAGVTSRVVPRA